MMNEQQFEDYQKYREAEEAKAAKREAEAEAARRKRQEDYEREKAEQEEWLKRNRPDEWERQEREKAEVQRMLQKRADTIAARHKWQATWKTESVIDVAREIVEATADINKFLARYYDAFDRPGPGLFRDWCHRIRDAYQREHHGK